MCATSVRSFNKKAAELENTIVITDLNGNIEYTNPKFTQVTGYTAAEVLGQNPRILNSGQQPKLFYKQLWETISAGNIWKGEFQNKTKKGCQLKI